MRLTSRGPLLAICMAGFMLLSAFESRLTAVSSDPSYVGPSIGALFITPAQARRNSRGREQDNRQRSNRDDERRESRQDRSRGSEDQGRSDSSQQDNGRSFDSRDGDRQWSEDRDRDDQENTRRDDRARDRDGDDSNDGNDGQQDTSDTSERDRDRRHRGNRADETETADETPDTVEGLLRQLSRPPVDRGRDSPRLPDTRITDETAVADDDILARDLSETDLKRARELGFDTEATTGMTAGPRITRLVPRQRNGRSVASELLKELVVRGGFHKNYRYVIYTPADATLTPGPDRQPEPGARTGQCRDDRCFGRTAICWTDDLARQANRVKIGIIDTPIDLEHPAFSGRRLRVGSFLGSYRRSLQDWHGTAVLALLSGNADSGVPGLAPDAEYFIAETFRTDDRGQATTDTVSLLKALEWLESQNVDLVNMSFSGPRDQLVEAAILRLQKRGMTFVAAAGNLGPTAGPSYPAAYSDVIAVTAITKEHANYPMANRGDFVDVSAPGVKIWTALPDGREGFRTGTSFASPFVTGLLAATWVAKARPSAKSGILSRLQTVDLGPPGNDPIFGRGLVIAPGGCASTTNVSAAPQPDDRPLIAPPLAAFGETVVTPDPVSAAAFTP